jgi:hypothetical protein
VAADATGAYIVVGATLRKYSDGGSELWTRSLQQEYTTSAVAADTSGVYAAVRDGYRHSLAKYSSNGTQLWIKRPRTMAPRVRNRFFHSIQCR